MINPRIKDESVIAFKCKGCGQLAFYFPEGYKDQMERGTVAHSKPKGSQLRTYEDEARGVSYVPCSLYRQSSASNYWAINKDAERVTLPDDFSFLGISNEN